MDKKKSEKKRPLSRQRKIFLGVALVVLAACATLVVSISTASASQEGVLYVRPGMTKQQLADTISARFGSRMSSMVMMLSRVRDIDTGHRTGAYKVERGMSAVTLWRHLTAGAQTPVRFSFNNLRTSADFAHAASSQLAMESKDMEALLADSVECARLGFTPQTIPAMLLADTYEVYWNVSPNDLLDKMKAAYVAFWTEERLAKAKALGLAPVEVATLASIVDSETQFKPERGTIARLYLNRIKIGMKLQSDPTAKFAAGDPTLRRITTAQTTIKSPYNTYYVEGLPIGPIRLPEKSTIDACLNAPDNDYIYMCAKEDFSGSHNFTKSYDEHRQNARRYQQALNARGIK